MENHFSQQQQQRMLNEGVIIISAAAATAQEHIFRVCSIRRTVCSLKVLFYLRNLPETLTISHLHEEGESS